jgi:hypothetical protein
MMTILVVLVGQHPRGGGTVTCAHHLPSIFTILSLFLSDIPIIIPLEG